MQAASPGGFAGIQTAGAGPNVQSASVAAYGAKPVNGGRFDFDDGGTYCGGWEDGKAHGHGVCTGPKGQGEYSGSWHFGFEVSGVYTWPSGSTFEGQWQNGKRHGLGTEYRGRWTYRGEWTQGFKGRYGVRQATASNAKYEGTWANGLQDGYGSEAYADGGTYQGQWLRGLRHGYGVRTSAPFGMASHFRPKAPAGSMASLKSESAAEPTSERDRRMDDVRGGFVLKARSDEPPVRRRSLVERSSNFKESILKGLKLRKQRSTGDLDKKGTNASTSIRSTASSASWMSNDSAQSAVTSGSHHTDSNASFVVEDEHMDTNVTETYMGEWKNDKRSGFGISERSDGLKYEGEWYNNKKYGYGVTTLKDGTKEEGKYKNNVLITSQKKKHLFLMRSAKFRERIDAAVNAAQRASKIALQKADIAISRTATARGKGEQADIGAAHAREDSDIARVIAKQFAPDFHQPGTEVQKPPIRGLSNQHQQQLLQATTADLTSKLSQARLKEDGGAHNRGRGRESSVEPRYDDHPSTAFHNQTHMSSSYDTHLPDRLDRNSLINQSIDNRLDAIPAYSMQQQAQQHQQQQQQQYHQQQPYSNRAGEMPPQQGFYNTPSMAPTRHSHQNLMDPAMSEPSKGLMGNNVMMNSVGGMGQGQSMGPGRHSMMNDSHGQGPPAHSQSHAYAPSGGMESGHDPASAMLRERGRDTMRRSNQMPPHPSRTNNPSTGPYNYQQAMSDHFDHYKRAPSRDSSTDRFNSRTRSRTRGQTPDQTPQSRASSRQRTPFMDQPPQGQGLPHNAMRSSTINLETMMMNLERAGTPSRHSGKDSPLQGGPHFSETGSVHSGSGAIDEMILRQRGLGQEIPPSLYTPKRTESLFLKSNLPGPPPPLFSPTKNTGGVGISGGGGGGGGGGSGVTVKRKKSLPDAVTLPKATPGMCREEIAALGSARRQEVRRQQDEAEKYRANPFLYLLNPNIKNWFSRQKLMVLVLFINLSLAILFLQLLS